MMFILFLIAVFLVRGVEFYLFIKKVSKLCSDYDWKYVDSNEHLVLEIIKKNYYKTNEWSAYNFLYLKGPSPFSIFFSFKLLTIENIYNKDIVEKIKKYANI